MNNKTQKILSRITSYSVALGLAVASFSSFANLEGAVNKALNNNPDFKQQWSDLLISDSDVLVAGGEIRPNVDLVAGYGWSEREQGGDKSGYKGGGFAEVQLSQLLYNGSVMSNIARMEEVQKVRYFELVDAANKVTFDTVRAYVDVKRQQDLLELATKNYNQHKEVFEKVEESFKAGVARSSDFEQISGRLALSESNMLSQRSNLQDVVTRYARIVGELPPVVLGDVAFDNSIYKKPVREQLKSAYELNPRFSAALHNIEAERLGTKVSKGAYKPIVELNASHGIKSASQDNPMDHKRTNITDTKIGVQVRYNLYRGGADKANIEKSMESLTRAQETRNAVCLDLQQEVQIANNDLRNIELQIPSLLQHMNSADKVRVAYADQFGIGSRTLLDVLDSENEFFQADMAHTNAQYDRVIRQAELLRHTGLLMASVNKENLDLPELRSDSNIKIDPNHVCPQFDLDGYAGIPAMLK